MNMNSNPETPAPEAQPDSWFKAAGKYLLEKLRFYFKNPMQVFWNPEEERIRLLFRVIVALMVFVLANFGVTMLILLLQQNLASSGSISSESVSAGMTILALFLQILLIIAPVLVSLWVMGKYFDKRPFKEYGFHFRKKWWLDLLFGSILGSVLVSVILLLEWAVGLVHIQPNNYQASLPVGPAFLFVANSLVLIAFIVAQEAIVHGFLQKNVAEGMRITRKPATFAILISLVVATTLFSIWPINGSQISALSIVNQVLIGLLLGFSFILTGDLAIAIGLGMSINILQILVFGFAISGVDATSSLFRVLQNKPDFITGGLQVPQGGLFGVLLVALGGLVLYFYVKLTRRRVALHENLAVYTPLAIREEENEEAAKVIKKKPIRSKKEN